MAAAADRCTRPANLRFAAALLLAAVLHTAVLWLPVVHDVKPNRILHRLTVSLQHTRMRQEAFIAAEQQPQPAPAAIPDRLDGPVAGETPSSGTEPPDMPAPPG